MGDKYKINVSLLNRNIGPETRKALLNKAVEEYDNGNEEHSIYYQVRALFSATQDRYFRMQEISSNEYPKYGTSFMKMKFESSNFKNNDKLLQFALDSLNTINKENQHNINKDKGFISKEKYYDLQNYQEPIEGFREIVELCKEFPAEWTILQVCKGPRPQTTYSTAEEIHQRDGDIYLIILRHARSLEYPEPICLRISDSAQIKVFEIFSKIFNDCKKYMQVEPKDVNTYAAKHKYWENLRRLDRNIREVVNDLKYYIFPWLFLFKGLPWKNSVTGLKKYQYEAFAAVDELCSTYRFKRKERVILSLATLHVNDMDDYEIEAICEHLSPDNKAQLAAQQLLKKLRLSSVTSPLPASTSSSDKETLYTPKNYPCILIIDEHLDHFYWEELNIEQEISRVNSLDCLWTLYKMHRKKIQNGYLCLNIKTGACVINPDSNLPNAQRRLESFFNYWTPSWTKKCGEKPTKEDLLQDYYKRDCYVYAGHGSGLQHVNGKNISRNNIDAVVFLFGCESTRMSSNGLYSDFVGAHIYYQAAKCPCLVGAILPALDTHMDGVSVELITRWIIPDSKDVLLWSEIDNLLWVKQGIIQGAAEGKQATIRENKNYQIGSLCGVITRIHARGNNKFYYSTVPYVCRGLPAWNCAVQSFPS